VVFVVFAVQIFNFQRNPNLFTKQNFFAKRKEVIDKESNRIQFPVLDYKASPLNKKRESHILHPIVEFLSGMM